MLVANTSQCHNMAASMKGEIPDLEPLKKLTKDDLRRILETVRIQNFLPDCLDSTEFILFVLKLLTGCIFNLSRQCLVLISVRGVSEMQITVIIRA